MDNIKNDSFYVEKILTDLKFIAQHMQGVSKQDLERNEILLDSMLFRLIQVQENARRLSEEYRAAHKSIPWTDISGLRNRIVHDYGHVDLRVVYDTLTSDVPWLVTELEK